MLYLFQKEQKLLLLRKRLADKKDEPKEQRGFLAQALISAPSVGAGSAVLMAAAVTASSGGASLEIAPR